MKAIIEHIDDELYAWCLLEYKHISLRLGKENVIFTNIKNKQDQEILKEIGTVHQESILTLQNKKEFSSLCLLDPKSEHTLEPTDKDKFDYFVFGGILGDHPMKGRTQQHFKDLKAKKRNIGNKQMSTDTAAIVCHKILDNNIEFTQLQFQDGIEIPLEEGMSNVFPYRYLIESDKIILTPGLIEHLKKEV